MDKKIKEALEIKKALEDGINIVQLRNIIEVELDAIRYIDRNNQFNPATREDTVNDLAERTQQLQQRMDQFVGLVVKYENNESVQRVYQGIRVSLDVKLPDEYKPQFKQFIEK